MKLVVLGSSSSGNCYVLDAGKEALILEAGIRLNEVKRVLGFNIRKVVGCLITHQHGDHAKYIKGMVDLGIPTLALPEVWAAKSVNGANCVDVIPGKGYKLGNFKVIPFPAFHDVPCVGYMINHPQSGNIMFLTDSYVCEYRFRNLNHVMIECNYADNTLYQAIREGRTLPSQRDRLLTSHMELETCKEYLKSSDLSNVNNIVLLHLSKDNGDEPLFVDEVEKATGKVVYAGKRGLTLDMDMI
nr:MAG TPA: YycJ-like protein [Caudoviricetes sp.]